VANEFAKMRHLRIVLVATALVVCVVGLSLMGAMISPDFADPAKRSWEVLLDSMSVAVPMISPILLAVLASRQVDIEHQGNGWLLSQTSGITPGGLCRVKLFALGTIVTAATVLESVLLIGIGLLLGITAPVPIGLWLGYTASILVVNLILLALHLLLSARIDNQLVGLGIGALGTIVAWSASGFPAWLAHASPPWGYYALADATEWRDGAGAPVTITPSYPSIAALGVVGAVLFLLVTSLFDRQET
jgi:hypothetical protein